MPPRVSARGSLGLLLKAGCNLYPTDSRSGQPISALSCALQVTSAECAEVFASHMALREKQFLALARSNLDRIVLQFSSLEESLKETIVTYIEHPHDFQFDVDRIDRKKADKLITKAIVECLERSKVHIPTHLRPSHPASQDIYHLPGMCLAFFPVFERHGFDRYNEPDQYGLRPIMADVRSICSISRNPLADNIKDLLPWFINHGCLDMRPVRSIIQPRTTMRLHEGATGWHYTSLLVIVSQWGRRQWWRAQSGLLATSLIRTIEIIALAGDKGCLDGCLCWCNLHSSPVASSQVTEERFSHGCSPFGFLCKQYLRHDIRHYFSNHIRQSFNCHDFWHHIFRHGSPTSGCGETSSNKHKGPGAAADTRIPMWQHELVRLLTFEALEMTHTCCSVHNLQPGSMQLAIFSHPSPEEARVRLIEDATEAEKLLQLEELMIEFVDHLNQGNGSSQDLEALLCGPWRTRIAGLYDICDRETKMTEDFLGSKMKTSK